DEKTGWCVSDINEIAGAFLKTTDGGQNWQIASNAQEFLSDIDFINKDLGWAVGFNGTIKGSTDGGINWDNLRIGEEDEALNSLYFIDSMRGWVVGSSGQILKTIDGGKEWQKVDTKVIDDLWRVRFLNEKEGWIVGEEGIILNTSDGGQTWQRLESGSDAALFDVWPIDANNVWVAGLGGSLFNTLDKGITWQKQTTNFNNLFRSIQFLDASDGGKTWEQVPVPRKYDLTGLKVISSESAWAVGRRGYIVSKH
ncbi:MAG: hypothetical protein FD167_5509, partial [bacterium]